MQKKKIQAHQVTENSILCDLICLEIQNSFLCSGLKIMQPQNVFFQKNWNVRFKTLDNFKRPLKTSNRCLPLISNRVLYMK